MTIALMRVDDRLIHGQVAFGWTSALGVNTILVINDEAKNDPIKATALNLAKPQNVKLYIRGVEEGGTIVNKFNTSTKSNVLILTKNVADAKTVIDHAGGVVKILNVGGLRYTEGKKKLNDLTSVSEEEIAQLNALQSSGVEIEFRMLPREKKKTLKDYSL